MDWLWFFCCKEKAGSGKGGVSGRGWGEWVRGGVGGTPTTFLNKNNMTNRLLFISYLLLLIS
jgi:hypothetical protein